MISLLAQNLIGVVDTAFIGRLGEQHLGGVALASLVYYCIYTVGYGLASGTQITISHRFGAGRYHDIGHLLGQSLRLLFLAALVMVCLSVAFGKFLFGGLISSPEVATSSIAYWNYRSFGYLFAFLGSGFRSFFVGIGKTKVLTINALVMSVVNIILDYALIFGSLGLPELGVRGAAIASVVAEGASLLFYLLYIHFRVDKGCYAISGSIITKHDGVVVRSLLKLSYYLMLQALLSQSVWTIFFFMIESLGERELAIAAIIRNLYILLFLPVNSYATAVRTTVGHLIGHGDIDKVVGYIWKSVRLSLGTMLVFTLFFGLFPQLPLRIFSDNMELIAQAVPALRVVCLAVLASSIGSMFFTSVGSTGNTRMVFNIELINIIFYLLYSAVMIYLLHASVAACFTVEIIYYTSIGTMSYLYMKRGKYPSAIV